MAKCHTCQNEYDKPFKVEMAGRSYQFDSFECAIQALAPQCAQCGCRIIGHGVESEERIFCCANCAGRAGVSNLRDRA